LTLEKVRSAPNSTSSHDRIYSTVKALGAIVKVQDGGISLLGTKAKALEAVIPKLRSDDAKAMIMELLTVVSALQESREKVGTAFNKLAFIINDEKNKQVAEAKKSCDAESCDAETQSPCWWDIRGTPKPRSGQVTTTDSAGTNADIPPPSWTDVVKKGRDRKPSRSTARVDTAEKPLTPQPRARARPSAILVNIGTDEFPELAKKIRGGVNQAVIGDSVVGMRQAKSGGLLIEVRGDQVQLEAVRAEVARSAGVEVEVRALQQRALVEIRDLDQWTSSGEVLDAVANSVSIDQATAKVISLRKRFGGTQSALVSLPFEASRRLLNAGRLRVGMVCCRARLADTKVRCFRCLSFGHMSNTCKGPDRTDCCRRCGEAGHKAASCSASDPAVSAFAKVIVAAKNSSS